MPCKDLITMPDAAPIPETFRLHRYRHRQKAGPRSDADKT
jgi:hypothetical protein